MTMIHVLIAALCASAAVIVWQWVRIRRLSGYASYLRRRLVVMHDDAMKAEARSRGVGGTGEHGAPEVIPLDKTARHMSMYDDPRFAIPSDRSWR